MDYEYGFSASEMKAHQEWVESVHDREWCSVGFYTLGSVMGHAGYPTANPPFSCRRKKGHNGFHDCEARDRNDPILMPPSSAYDKDYARMRPTVRAR